MQFVTVGMFRDGSLATTAGISDIILSGSGSAFRIHTVTRAGGAALTFEIRGGSASGLRLLDTELLAAGSGVPAPSTLVATTIGGQPAYFLAGPWNSRIGGFTIAADGTLTPITPIIGSASGAVSALTAVQIGTSTFFFAARSGEATLEQYRLLGNGRWSLEDEYFTHGGFQGVDLRALQTTQISGEDYLYVLSSGQDALRSYRVEASGHLTALGTLGAAGGMGVADPAAMEIISHAGNRYGIIAASGTSTLSVVRLGADGRMTLTDHLGDTRDTRFQGVQALATVAVGDRQFVLAGGGDDGLNLMQLLPNGRLLVMAQTLRTATLPLDNITALAATVRDGWIEVFAGGERAGLMRLRIAPGNLAAMQNGTEAADTLTGGTNDDLLWGKGGNDRLTGGNGDDIVMDGAGNDTLIGGAGADTFVLTADGDAETITDFQIGVDRLNLSGWGRIYSVQALQLTARADGITIRWGAEQLTLLSASGGAIAASSLRSADLFEEWHIDVEAAVEGRRLTGTAAAEHQLGNRGDDTLVGSDGADRLDGGAGHDLADYDHFTTALMIDLANPGANGGAAAGDVLLEIESLFTGSGDDTLRGTSGGNLLRANGGHDLLDGRGGADTLNAGAGDDTLIGGAGADVLRGGDGRDRASWITADAGVLIDLRYPEVNKGDAAGDKLESIEDVEGSDHADTLVGDTSNNQLYGAGGADELRGRTGNDLLDGGEGNDWLVGEGGDDTLIGGAGFDWGNYDGRATITIDLDLVTAQETGLGRDQVLGIEAILSGEADDQLFGTGQTNHFRSGDGNDRLEGRGGDDELEDGAGNDSLYAGDGADRLTLSLGNDRIDGGAGVDRLIFSGPTAITIDLLQTGWQATGQGSDWISGIEEVSGGLGADWFRGDAGDNWLSGQEGADSLSGYGGQDAIFGGDGDDWLNGGGGNDTLNGGAGRDTVWLGNRGGSATLSSATDWLRIDGLDLMISIEGLAGGTGNHRLTGDTAANILSGGAGQDWLTGYAGNDTLIGGTGNDTLIGGLGRDRLEGGAGRDLAILTGEGRVRISLGNGTTQTVGNHSETLLGIESVQSGSGWDWLFGSNYANRLTSGAGNDWLRGLGGNDTLAGGRGNDLLDGGRGADDFIFDGGRDRITDFSRRAGDEIKLDRSELGIRMGASAYSVVREHARDTGRDVVLDFGRHGWLVIDDLASITGLYQAIDLI